jgi:hypothetical protein
MDSPKRSAMLVGRNPRGRWSESELTRLLDRASDWSRRQGSRLLVVTTRESADAADWLRDRAGEGVDVYAWRADDHRNPYGLALEHGAALVVAGGSPGVLQDALSAPKPVYLLPNRPTHGLASRFADRIAQRAFRPSYNKRGSVRPQQGLTYLCARLIERGWVTPPTGLLDWQRKLVDRGLAAWVNDDAVPAGRYRPELERVCSRVLDRLDPARGRSTESERQEPGGC